MGSTYWTAKRIALKWALPPLRILRDLATFIGRIVPDVRDHSDFRQFLGDGVSSSDSYFVMDSYETVRLRTDFRRAQQPSGSNGVEPTGSEIIDGAFSPQAAAMLTALFLRHTGKVLRIATDTELGQRRDATLICYGPSDSNFKTFDIEAWSGSNLCRFSFEIGEQRRAFCLGGQSHSIESRDGVLYDKAILLRLANREDPRHCYFVCAGLTEWGNLAAVYYLTRKWKELHQRFDDFGQRRDFCVLLEVPCGQFRDAKELVSAVCWEPRLVPEPVMVSSHA